MQRVAAGHQAAHEALQTFRQEMYLLRSQIETRSRIRLVEPKSLMPDRFGKKTSPSWRPWSYLANDFVGVIHRVVKQARKNAENQKQPISVTHLQHEFGVTNEMDQELQHFLISITEGEALAGSLTFSARRVRVSSWLPAGRDGRSVRTEGRIKKEGARS